MGEEKSTKELKREIQSIERNHKKRLLEKDQEREKLKKSYNRTIRDLTEQLDKYKGYYEKEKSKRKSLEKKIEDHGLRRRVKKGDEYERRGKRRTKKQEEEPVCEDDGYISSE